MLVQTLSGLVYGNLLYIVAVGLALIFGLRRVVNLARTIWRNAFRSLPVPDLLSGAVKISGQGFPVYRLMVVVVAALVAVGLSLCLRYSRLGLFVRASAIEPITKAVQGVNIDRVSMSVVALGAAAAGLSGIIAASVLGLSPSMWGLRPGRVLHRRDGWRPGHFSGAFVAALVIGQIHNFGVAHQPRAAPMIPFLLTVAALVSGPMGIAGSRSAHDSRPT
ncbi:MAG: hypothetical protein P4L96_11380 [Rhodoferax sp.]|nr:hypothetical protein [Rhodoferax sp.]